MTESSIDFSGTVEGVMYEQELTAEEVRALFEDEPIKPQPIATFKIEGDE